MESEHFALLQESAKILQEIASFYVSDNPYAVRARRKVQKKAGLSGNRESFHAALLSRLAALNEVLRLAETIPIHDLKARQVVFDTLLVFDNLLDDAEDDSAAFSGLHRLLELHSYDRVDARRPKPLGFRMCLYCPSQDNQTRLKDQIVHCTNALAKSTSENAITTGIDSGSILADTEHLQEWRPPADLTQDAERLHHLLLPQLMHCDCGAAHEHTKLSLWAGALSRSRSPCYSFCYPSADLPLGSWHVLRTQNANMQATVKAQIQGSSRVRFADEQTDVQSAGLDHWQRCSRICQVDFSSGLTTDLCVNEEGIWTAQLSTRSHRVHLVSLRTASNASTDSLLVSVSKKERIILALTLSYVYLHFSGTAWWPSAQINPDFYFVRDLAQGPVVQKPFMTVERSEHGFVKTFSVEAFMNDQRPSLPAFGKLLLEIWKGGMIEWSDLDSVIQECSEDYIGSYWLCAVNACLGEDAVLKEPGNIREAAALRATFVHKVVKSFQWLLENLCRLSVDAVFAASDESGEAINKGSMTATAQPNAASKRKSRYAPYNYSHAQSHALEYKDRSNTEVTPEDCQSSKASEHVQLAQNGPKRLVNTRTFQLEEFTPHEAWPEYAILSHRWSAAEVTFADMDRTNRDSKLGWSKIVGACRRAQADGLEYVWVDSCCINKDSSSELNESLNSMFRWYRDARVCYVYLADVQTLCTLRDGDGPQVVGSKAHRMLQALTASDWFLRGWTLQEMLAPKRLKFFGADWSGIGDLSEMAEMISSITRIDVDVLRRKKPLTDCSIAQRFSWAASRTTLRPEDEAYCLLGLFEVSLEAVYGIGRRAFQELQKKILDSGKADDSLFAWNSGTPSVQTRFFARSAADFQDCGDVVCVWPRQLRTHVSSRSDGIGGRLAVLQCREQSEGWSGQVALLNCIRIGRPERLLAIRLRTVGEPFTKDQPTDYAVTVGSHKMKVFRGGEARADRLLSILRHNASRAAVKDATIAYDGSTMP